MAYSINPNLIKARKEVLRAVIFQKMPIYIAARRHGVHRTTIWRWIKKWREINKNVQLENINRPSRPVGSVFRWHNVNWAVPTLSSTPKTHPSRIATWIVDRILALRAQLNRCAVIIRAHLLKERIQVSVSTIRRVIARHSLQKTKKRHFRRTLPRPEVTAPGDLVEMDTVHYVNKLTGDRRYIFTVIDLYSRMAYSKCFDRLLPGNALATLLAAERYFGFKIKVIQTDNGPEFGKWFSERTKGKNIVHRHTRIHRPNDNGHIERFNRTLREECIGDHMRSDSTTEGINRKLRQYVDSYNGERLHLGLQCRTPRGMLQR